MDDGSYLLTAMPVKKEDWSLCLSEILMSDSLEIGFSYNESLPLLFKYRRRLQSTEIDIKDTVGLYVLIKRLAALEEHAKFITFPLKK